MDRNANTDKPVYLKPPQAADYIKYSAGTLANWRSLQTGPRYYKANGGRILYLQSELDDFIKATAIEPR